MHIVWRLGGTPERQFIVRVEVSNGRVLFHGQVSIAFIEKGVLANQIGFGKSFVDLAKLQRH